MKRRIWSALLAFIMALSLLPTAALAGDEGITCDGTNCKHIAEVTKSGSDKEEHYNSLAAALTAAKDGGTVKLLKNVTLQDEWTPIANFAGTLDGNNKTIYSLSVKSTNATTDVNNKSTSGAGLFAYLRGKVYNLTIDGAVIDVPNEVKNVGVLAGRAEYNEFTNVKITNATITSNAQYVGGLIGFGYGNVTGCEVSNSTITGKDQVGGLFGYHKLINVQNNTLTNNDVTATEERAGGIFGKLQVVLGDLGEGTATLSGCTVSGGSATAPDYAGGVAGQLMGAGDKDDTNRYSITGNEVENFTLNAEKEKSSFATIRDGDYETFLNALSDNVKENTLEDISGTLDETWRVKSPYTAAGGAYSFTVYERCVAQIGDEKYTTLNAAIEAAKDGDTVNIINDCRIAPVEIDPDDEEAAWTKGIIIEGNGHTVTGWDTTDVCGSAIDVINSKVTFNNIKFTDFACKEENTNMLAAVIVGYSGCDITVTNCSFKNFNRQAIDFSPRYSAGNLTVTGCTFDCTPVKDTFTIQKAIIISPKTNASSSTVEIEDCKISHAESTAKPKWSAGGIEINGGVVSVENCTMTNCEVGILASREYWGESDADANIDITLKDTSISAWNAAVWLECYKSDDTNTTAAIAIESGYYKGAVGIGENNEPTDDDLKKCSISLTGGYYSVEPDAEYVHADYYVDASNKSGYPYVVKQGTKPDSAIVVIEDKTTPSISNDETKVGGLTDSDKTAIIKNTKVEGVTEAVAGSKNVLVANSGINTAAAGVEKVEVDVDVKVELTAADLSAANKTMTYTATPVATVTTTYSNSGGENTTENVAVPNYMLSGEMTVRLPLPAGFDLKQIIHRSSGYADEYILAKGNAQGLKSFKLVKEGEVALAVFTVTHFSTFELSSEVTYVAPVVVPSVSTYAVTVEDSANGSVTASSGDTAKGSTVTLTVKPDEGYLLNTLVVSDKDGEEVKLTDKGDGKYTFTMPGGKVTVSAVFVEDYGYERGYASCPKDVTCPVEPYADAVNTAWYHDGVHFCLENGLMVGLPDGSFAPSDSVTRAQVVTILWRLEDSPVVNYAMQFEDVTADSWCAEAIRWAASNGVVTGYSDAAFGPNDAITREQFAAILYRYSQFKGYDVSVGEDTNIMDYDDVRSISSYAVPTIQWACGSGLMSGVSTLTLDPTGVTSRAQAATMFMRYCAEIVK